MALLESFIDIILHLDHHLLSFVHQYGALTYMILFIIILLETGVVVTPFLPGDSLIFTAGAIAAQGSLNIYVLLVLLIIAASLGDTLNYFIGRTIGLKVLNNKKMKLINVKYIQDTQEFYNRKGSKFIVLARFIPIIRTFAPFVAGIGKMNYSKFITYNILGATLWVSLMVLIGFFFGNISLVKNHFGLLTIGIIIVSVVPIVKDVIISFMKKSKNRQI
ncbi:VTT domain-containing protein [Bacillus sp. EAC]|uniref:VTT domain-containing protein n=1 Tax=Bacillus sp. EAC TaxID=1978338 RepID=UPI000B43E658|nr:VTT domain-containing protein [Bacillus sp. EAC]